MCDRTYCRVLEVLSVVQMNSRALIEDRQSDSLSDCGYCVTQTVTRSDSRKTDSLSECGYCVRSESARKEIFWLFREGIQALIASQIKPTSTLLHWSMWFSVPKYCVHVHAASLKTRFMLKSCSRLSRFMFRSVPVRKKSIQSTRTLALSDWEAPRACLLNCSQCHSVTMIGVGESN